MPARYEPCLVSSRAPSSHRTAAADLHAFRAPLPLEYITSIAQLYFAHPHPTGVPSYNSLFSLSAPLHYIYTRNSTSSLPLAFRSLSPPSLLLAFYIACCLLDCCCCSRPFVLRTPFHTCTAYQPFANPPPVGPPSLPFLGPVICLIVYRAHYLFVILYLFCNLRVV